jgi:hypothetical protein
VPSRHAREEDVIMREDFTRSKGYLDLGDRHMKRGNVAEAIRCYQQALESCPADALLHQRVVSQRLREAMARDKGQDPSAESTGSSPHPGHARTIPRYCAKVVTNRNVTADMAPRLSQGLWEELRKQEPALDRILQADIGPSTPCEFEFSLISCPEGVFFDTAKRALGRWVQDTTGSTDVPFRGPFVCAGSVQVGQPSGGTKTIKYVVSLLAFGLQSEAEPAPRKWWQFWK